MGTVVQCVKHRGEREKERDRRKITDINADRGEFCVQSKAELSAQTHRHTYHVHRELASN